MATQQKVYQVFVGCPFERAMRSGYDKLKKEIESTTPLHVVLADTVAVRSTDYLLESITTLISESAGCIFDTTGGNPNVSLEVGIAHALPSEFLLTLKTRKTRATKTDGKNVSAALVKPIISDLQGRKRIEYKTYNALRDDIVRRYLPTLAYYRRWQDFKKRARSYIEPALPIFEELRSSGRTVRPRVVASLDGSGISATDLLEALRLAKLITIKRGRTGGIFYAAK